MEINTSDLLAEAKKALRQWPFIPAVEAGHKLPWGLLLAVGSRETNLVNEGGDVVGGIATAHGPWQGHGVSASAPVETMANSAAATLAANYQALGTWRLAADAYNRGIFGVRAAMAGGGGAATADAITAHGDYGPDVVARLAVLVANKAELIPSPAAPTKPAATTSKGVLMLSIDVATGRLICPAGTVQIRVADPFPVLNGQAGGFAEPAWGTCLHTESGFEAGTTSWFENPAAQVSAHFGVALDGSIDQYGPVGKGWMAWAEMAGNPHYISIETEDDAKTMPWSSAQLATLAELLVAIHAQTGAPLVHVDHGGHGVTQHSFSNGQGDPAWGGHVCPGPDRLAQIPSLVAAAAGIAAGSSPPPVTKTANPTLEDILMLPSDYKALIYATYATWLMREPDAAGYASWYKFLSKGGTAGAFISGVIDSAECQAKLPKVLAGRRKLFGLD